MASNMSWKRRLRITYVVNNSARSTEYIEDDVLYKNKITL